MVLLHILKPDFNITIKIPCYIMPSVCHDCASVCYKTAQYVTIWLCVIFQIEEKQRSADRNREIKQRELEEKKRLREERGRLARERVMLLLYQNTDIQ